ncbi:MAG: PilZ domain-containing protein [bacterium]|jgi:c-di-GMP-binding flagellar brake protein YcgR|nr:PilZ domain-containing protein [bacterium]
MITEVFSGTERRQALRIKFDGQGEIKGKSMDGLVHAITCHFLNLSEGGACLKTNVPVTENSELNLNFKLPGLLNMHLSSTATVVWCILQPEEQCYLVGIAFRSFKATELTALRSFIYIQNKRGNVL